METKPVLFCDGCPMIPKGVRAELVDTEVIGHELYRYRAFVESPELREHFKSKTRLHARVTACNDGTAEVGSDAAIIVDECAPFKEAASLVNNCGGAISVNRLQRILGIKTRCGAFDNRYR